jgi:hypothetical protein
LYSIACIKILSPVEGRQRVFTSLALFAKLLYKVVTPVVIAVVKKIYIT